MAQVDAVDGSTVHEDIARTPSLLPEVGRNMVPDQLETIREFEQEVDQEGNLDDDE